MVRQRRSWLVRVIVVFYLITFIWGVPAVQTETAMQVIRYYKSGLQHYPGDVFPRHPYVRFGAAYPLLPFIVVNHYEYHTGVIQGWGGFDVWFWHVTGSKRVFRWTKWIS